MQIRNLRGQAALDSITEHGDVVERSRQPTSSPPQGYDLGEVQGDKIMCVLQGEGERNMGRSGLHCIDFLFPGSEKPHGC